MTSLARALRTLRSRGDLVLLGLSLGGALAVSARIVDYAYDDAYITYRYARNLLRGDGFVYNLGEPHLGTTTPLYTLWLAGLGRFVEIPVASGWLCVASLCAGIALLEAIGRRAGVRCAGSAAGLFLIANPELHALFGGEMLPLHLALLPLGYWLHRRGNEQAGAFVFGLAILTRFDAVLFPALVYGEQAWRRRRLPLAPALVIGATLLPWLAFATFSFGQPLPSTLGVKMAMGDSGQWPLYLEGSARYLGRLPEYSPMLRAPFLALAALGLVRICWNERVWLPFVVYSAAVAAVYQVVLGVAFSHWYLAHVYLANALLLGAGLRQLFVWSAALARSPAPPRRVFAAAALALLGVGAVASYLVTAAPALARFEVHPARHVLYRRVGEWLRDNTPPNATVHFFEIGYVGWYSDRTLIDRVGLVTPGAEEALRQGDVAWALRRYRPDYYVLNTRLGIPQHVTEPEFRRRYELVARLSEPELRGEVRILARRAEP